MSTTLKSVIDETRRERLMQALRSILERTLRIVLKDSGITAILEDSGPAPAWSNIEKRTVHLNVGWIDPSWSVPTVVRVSKGLLYHEAAHLMWTPSGYGKPNGTVQRLVDGCLALGMSTTDALNAFNVLEDKRIETNFVKRYRPAAAYFAKPLYEYIANDANQTADFKYASVTGRPWLDARMMRALRTEAIAIRGSLWITELELIAKTFVKFTFTDFKNDPTKIADCIFRFHQLLQQAGATPDGLGGTCTDGCRGDHHDSAEATGERSETPRTKAEQPPLDPKGGVDDSDLDEMQSESDTEADKAEAEGDDGTESGNGSGNGTDDGNAEGTGGTEESTGSDAPTQTSASDIAREVAATTDEAIGDDVASTAEAVTRAAASGDTVETSTRKALWDTTTQPVTADMRAASRKIASVLTEIRNAASPEWLHGEPMGRLNIVRAMDDQSERLDVFDLWDEGTEDEMRMKIAFGLDLSGSMSQSWQPVPEMRAFHRAAQMLWTLQDAFTIVDHDFDAYGYDDRFQRLTERHRKDAYYLRHPRGSTEPLRMINNMITRMAAAHDCTDRLLVIITDGAWDSSDSDDYRDRLDAFRSIGGQSHLFVLESGDQRLFTRMMANGVIDQRHPYGFDEWSVINDPADLVAPMASIVQQTMKGHLRR